MYFNVHFVLPDRRSDELTAPPFFPLTCHCCANGSEKPGDPLTHASFSKSEYDAGWRYPS